MTLMDGGSSRSRWRRALALAGALLLSATPALAMLRIMDWFERYITH